MSAGMAYKPMRHLSKRAYEKGHLDTWPAEIRIQLWHALTFHQGHATYRIIANSLTQAPVHLRESYDSFNTC